MDIEKHSESIYSEIIMDHYQYPFCKELKDKNYLAEVRGYNSSCGDEILLRIHSDYSISYKTRGCVISQASASIMCEIIKDVRDYKKATDKIDAFSALMQSKAMPSSEQSSIDLGDAVVLSGIAKYPVRIRCAMLAWTALRDAMGKAAAKLDSLSILKEGES
jgi:nitrogen fixation NifU-like protein